MFQRFVLFARHFQKPSYYLCCLFSYKCPHCPMACNNKSNFNKHLRVHTGEKPYECRICLKKFRHINSLRRHQRQVHRKTPAEVDASPRGADMLPSPGRGFPGAPGAPASPYPQYPVAPANLANRAALKSVLEMRQMQAAAAHNPAMNNYVRQMQLQQQYQLQQQQQQQQAAWQQQLIRSMSQHNLNMAPKAAPTKSTNHSIASMISDAPTIINSKYSSQNFIQIIQKYPKFKVFKILDFLKFNYLF